VNQAERGAARQRHQQVAEREREQREEEDDAQAGQARSLAGLELLRMTAKATRLTANQPAKFVSGTPKYAPRSAQRQ